MPTDSRRFLLLFTTCLILFTLFDYVAGAPAPVDSPMHFGLWTAIAVQFFLWISSMHSWGKILAPAAGVKQTPPGISLAVGALFYALIALLLASVGLLSPGLRYFLFIIQALGLAWIPAERIKINKELLIASLPLALLCALNLADSFYIHPYWDPLHHHLTGARLFWEKGKMHFPTQSISAYQEGGFEMLFLWPHFFFAKAGGLGLLPVQIFSQLTHCALGFGGSLLIAHSLAQRWLTDKKWQLLAVTLFAIPASLQFAVPTAKNDWGIVLWLLAGFWLLCRESQTKKTWPIFALAGLFWGYAWLAKLSAGFAIAGLAAIFLFRRPKPKEIISFTLAFLAGAFPLALRNYLGTGDPLFPLFPDFFPLKPGAMGPTWREALRAYQAESGQFLLRLKEFALEFPLAPAIAAVPLIALKKKEDPALRACALAIAVSFLLFAALAGKATELRLLGAILPLAALLVAVLVQRLSRLLFFLRGPWLPWALLAALALALPYRKDAIYRIRAIPYADLLTRNYASGEAQGWFRDNHKPEMRAAVLVETRLYHSLPFPMVRIWDAPLLDAKLRHAQSGAEFVKILKEEHFTHLILSKEKLDLFYPKDTVGMVEAYVLPQEQAIVFRTPMSVVAEINKLK